MAFALDLLGGGMMGVEIERKFLLRSDAWRKEAGEGLLMKQGYFAVTGATIRIRIASAQGFLTVKGPSQGFARSEYEYEIPLADAEAMLREFCSGHTVSKKRYRIPAGNGLTWEVDEYFGENAPLFTAEIELPEESAPFERPAWLGEEISGDRRYTNKALSQHPYGSWEA